MVPEGLKSPDLTINLRFTRSKRIGEAYTEEAIRNRIENRDFEKSSGYQESKTEKVSPKSETKDKPKTLAKQKQKSRINMIVDISKNLKAQQSKGYEHALIRANINTLVQTMNYLISHDLQTPENFERHYMDVNAEYKFLMKSNKKISSAMLDLSEKIKFTQNYKKNKWIYIQSLKARNKQEFYREHEQEIIQYKASLIYYERKEINPDSLNLSELFEEYRQLKSEKVHNDELLNGMKEKLYDLETIKKNLENSLNIKFEEINERETKERERKSENRDEQEKSERD